VSAALAVQLTVDELHALVRTAVREELNIKKADVDLMTRDDVAEMLDVHPRVVTTYVRTKGLPAKKIERKWLFSRREINAWLEEQAVRPGAPTEKWGKKMRRSKP
jgi:excisionase family DNA binding protein